MSGNLALSGKRALVTGSGVRLGRAMALRLAEEGCDLIIHYHSSDAGARATAEQVSAAGRRAELFRADLSDFVQLRQLTHFATDALGGLDILVNSASYFPQPQLEEAKHHFSQEREEDWDRAFAINAKAPFFLSQHLAPALEASRGSIVNILDLSSSRAFLSRATHSVSKAALRSITQLTARALQGKVRVNALELGAILPAAGSSEEFLRGRRWGGAEVVLDGLIFLLTNTYVNGEVLRITGDEDL